MLARGIRDSSARRGLLYLSRISAPSAHATAYLRPEDIDLEHPSWSFMTRGFSVLRRACVLCALAAVFCLLATPLHASDSAKSLFNKGRDAEARQDYDAAYSYYNQAWLKSPKDARYKTSAARMRPEAAFVHIKIGRKLKDDGDMTGAVTEFLRALSIDPSLEIAKQEIDAIRRKQNATPPVELKPGSDAGVQPTEEQLLESAEAPVELKPISNEPLTIHENEDSKLVYQTIGKLAGLNVLFDSDYTSKRVEVDLTNTTLYDALRIVGAITGTFWKPVTPNTIFVAQDNRSKRSQLEQQAVRTFYLTNPSQQQDLNDVQTALRNVLGEGPKFFNVPSQNAIVGRGTPDQLLLAEKIIDDLDKPRAEVELDIAVMEVSKDKLRTIGIQLPGTVGFQLQPSNASATNSSGTCTDGSTNCSTTGTNLTLDDFRGLNATNFAVTISSATANLLLSDSDTRILEEPRIRASDNQKATLKIGSRIPVATGSYQTSAATTAVSGLVNTQFQYLDIGVNVEVTPTVHYDRDVTLKLKIEDLSENGSSTISGVTEPIIGQRSIEHTIRLKEGEANILGGIFSDNDSRSAGGWPGIGELPVLKYLFSSRTHEVTDDEIVFVLIPHVVRAHELTPLNLRTIDTGTGNTVELRHASFPISSLDGNVSGTPMHDTPASSASPAALRPAQPGGPMPPTGPAPFTPAHPAPATVANPAAVNLTVDAPVTPEKPGTTFQVKVNLANGKDVYSVPMELHYDPARLTLINVDSGDLLERDGQAVALVHRDDGNGKLVVNAARPPGVKGITGNGTVCTATFVAKTPGAATISVTSAMPRDSAQQPIPATLGEATVQIQ